MSRRAAFPLAFAIAGFLLLGLACTEEETTAPGPTVVTMSGAIELPEGSYLDPEELTLGFGDHDQAVSASAQFEIKGNEGIPGLAVAYDADSVPVLLAVTPRPTEGMALAIFEEELTQGALFHKADSLGRLTSHAPETID